MDINYARCKNYKRRRKIVPSFLKRTPKNLNECLAWLPDGCSYSLLARGNYLPSWHPLMTKDPDSVFEAGVSVNGKVIYEDKVLI